ncbi:MAG: ATP-binding cassette domain-containing protein, partial [Thaumarchaeota archaeon]|nr:ATP-binding cassette domain-containing protein [Nitrososphaerota archaeon]
MQAIELDHVRRIFRTSIGTLRRHTKEVVALDDVSLDVAAGELFGLIGPNGAGKTTTVKILTTLLIPTDGRATVLGHDVVADTRFVRRNVGFLFGGERGLYFRVSGRANLEYFAELYALPPRGIAKRVDELLALVGLSDRGAERVEGYSRGMKQRLHLARTLLHDPPVLFLDEPTSALDPLGRRQVREILLGLRAAGKTIFLNSHLLSEVELVSDRVAVMYLGKIVEIANRREIYQSPEHPYTSALL